MDYDGWVDASIYLPEDYDLVLLKLADKTLPGWWNGIRWDGYRVKGDEKVLYWKFKEDREGRYEKEKQGMAIAC